jgi:hypothetical protein
MSAFFPVSRRVHHSVEMRVVPGAVEGGADHPLRGVS